MKTTIITFFVLLILSFQINAQQYLEKQFKGYTNPDELISLSANVGFNQAVDLLSKISESTTGRRIISTVQIKEPIGLEISNMTYDKALVVLVQYHNLTYDEKEDIIVIKRKNDPTIDRTPETYASVNSRDIKISAVFFEMDVNESRERGVDWKVIFSKSGLNIGSEIVGTTTGSGEEKQQQNPPNFNLLGNNSNFDLGSGWSGEASALFKFFEEENIGEIIASPNIIVRDRNKGRIQVGSDFAVKKQDFAGNIIETFFPTGTIIEVTPFIYEEDNVNYVLMDVLVERSSFVDGTSTTEIRKTNAETQTLMLNGEQTVLGGLFINEETVVRNGVPLLKDLPWWFFGLRYIFGSDQTITRKKELVILLEVEILPTLKERLTSVSKSKNLIQDQIQKNKEQIKVYQLDEKQYNK
jgi:general secretion pathway protein D